MLLVWPGISTPMEVYTATFLAVQFSLQED